MTALRVTYELKSERVKIISTKPVTTRVPPSPPSSVLDRGTGAWIEVRDAKGERIWARLLDENFLAAEIRTQTGYGIGNLTRVAQKSLTERVLIPCAEGGKVLFLHRAAVGKKPKVLGEQAI